VRAFVAHTGVDALRRMLASSLTGATPEALVPLFGLTHHTSHRSQDTSSMTGAANRIHKKEPSVELISDTSTFGLQQQQQQCVGGARKKVKEKMDLRSRAAEKEPSTLLDAAGADACYQSSGDVPSCDCS
jgi:hypothetical protein